MNYGNFAQNYNVYKNYNEQQLIQQQNQYFQKLNQVLDNHQNVTKMYQNVNYQFTRRERKTLIIEYAIGTGTTFNEDLIEPLIIDKHSDIYLEHFTTFNAKKNTSDDEGNNMAFLINIDQFNIQNSTNDSNTQGTFIIPNEETEDTSGGGSSVDSMRIHKGKKMNFICSINPTKLTKISGSITNLNNEPGFSTGKSGGNGGRFVLELVIIPRNDD